MSEELKLLIKSIQFSKMIPFRKLHISKKDTKLLLDYIDQLAQENQQLNEALDRKNYFKYKNKTYDGKIVLKQLDLYKSVIDEVKELLKQGIIFCENDSQGFYDKCNIAIAREKKALEILDKVEGKNE